MMSTTADLFPEGHRRGDALTVRLNEAWSALSRGAGSKVDYELIIGDLAEASGYFYVSPDGTSDAQLREREGARKIFARILFLLDIPMAKLAEMRQAALVELAITNDEGDR